MLSLQGLRTRFVGPLDLTLQPAECVCLSGASGTGKTLLLRAIADLDPHEGSVCLDGRDSRAFPPAHWRRQVGMLPAESQWWSERVGDHFEDLDAGDLAALGFPPQVMDWTVAHCSTGERQRLALLRLLQNRPRVLLLDEPTASLDPENVTRVEKRIQEYRGSEGACVLWVSHDQGQIARVCQRHFNLAGGRLAAS